MVNLEKVRIMTKLAAFEKTEEKASIKITKYYQGDYVRCELLKTLACITMGYVGLCLFGILYQLEYLVSNATKLDYEQIFGKIMGVYCVLLVIYGVFVSLVHTYRYSKARKKVKQYDRNLHALRQWYRKEQENKQKIGNNRG